MGPTSTKQQPFSLEIFNQIRYPTLQDGMSATPDGRYVAIALKGPHDDILVDPVFTEHGLNRGILGSYLIVADTVTGGFVRPTPEGSTSWGPSWSPDGTQLAFCARDEGYACLALWNRESGEFRLLRDVTIRPYSGFEYPRWTPDGARIVMQTYSGSGSQTAAPWVKVHRFDPNEIQETCSPSFHVGDISVIDADTGACRTLAADWRFFVSRISPTEARWQSPG